MSKSKYPLVAIVILNWNGKKLLKTCLSTLFQLTNYPNYKVVVVDNGSIDGSIEIVKKYFPKVDVLALGKNYGFVKGNNEGIKYVLKKYSPDYILLLNNDTKIIQKNWLTEMVKVAESDEKVGIVGCKMLSPTRKITVGRVLIFRKSIGECNRSCDVDAVSGACMLISRDLISSIGLLDEVYSPYYFEDTDYCWRAKKKGFRIIYHGKATIIHLKGSSMKMQEPIYNFFIRTKNGLIFTFRYFPIIEKIKEFHRDFLQRFFLFFYAFFLALKTYRNFRNKKLK
ncbi:MAG: hypothetical protein B6U95_09135 [Thermofilum sp. ex4484_82]|nr:MAG: hypothetical protein B6U95_09135 [Thermofilum sp. ex4484_82]OYT35979.1 MAG: hypothetical protein B6U96_09145 [Archaeoglobales archaeon ex4484_92]